MKGITSVDNCKNLATKSTIIGVKNQLLKKNIVTTVALVTTTNSLDAKKQKYAIKGDCFNNDLTKLEQMRFKILLRLLQKNLCF